MDFFRLERQNLLIISFFILLGIIAYFSPDRVNIFIQAPGDIAPAMAETVAKPASLSKKAKEHFLRGQKLLKSKNLDQALKEFQSAAKLSPKSPVTHYWVGMAYFYKKQPEKAIANFKKVLKLDAKNYHTLAMIGKILSFQKDKLDEAANYLKKSLALNMDYADAHFDLGRIHAMKGDMGRALAEFGFIFKSEPRYALYHFELGKIFESMKAVDRAKQEYKRALQLNPKMAAAKKALTKLK